ncbi:hypothetical protein PANDA_019489 [Ailuropoda melanoleuca]|uniref:EF-hand domain-containing protein n=1 Tax=Ailuropoda melanoleuca TaxID=9646 RepID=D2I293_AILME|nr:hypothetical protein PANDA_019489 [Ailuropoda melanoleuca]
MLGKDEDQNVTMASEKPQHQPQSPLSTKPRTPEPSRLTTQKSYSDPAGSTLLSSGASSSRRLCEIREAFRVLDRDGNGFISKQELGMAMRSLGYMPSEVELAIIMQRLDMDAFNSFSNHTTMAIWNESS